MATEYLNNKFFESVICEFQQVRRDRTKYGLFIKELQDTIERKKIRNVSSNREDSLLEIYIKLQKDSVDKEKIAYDKLANCFFELSTRVVGWAKFPLIDIDDATQEGVLICFEKIDRFIPGKGKAFNYMTTCIMNHLKQLYRGTRNYNELKRKYSDFINIQLNSSIYKNGKEIKSFKSNDK